MMEEHKMMRFGFMPGKDAHPFHTKIKKEAARLKISMSRLCAESLGKPDYAKSLKDGHKPSQGEIEVVNTYILNEREKRRKRAEDGRALGNTKNAENHDNRYLSCEMGSKALLRALLSYGIRNDGLPGMAAKDLITAARDHKITITYDARLI